MFQGLRFRATPPSDGKRYRYNLIVEFQGRTRVYENLDDESTAFRRIYCGLRRAWERNREEPRRSVERS